MWVAPLPVQAQGGLLGYRMHTEAVAAHLLRLALGLDVHDLASDQALSAYCLACFYHHLCNRDAALFVSATLNRRDAEAVQRGR